MLPERLSVSACIGLYQPVSATDRQLCKAAHSVLMSRCISLYQPVSASFSNRLAAVQAHTSPPGLPCAADASQAVLGARLCQRRPSVFQSVPRGEHLHDRLHDRPSDVLHCIGRQFGGSNGMMNFPVMLLSRLHDAAGQAEPQAAVGKVLDSGCMSGCTMGGMMVHFRAGARAALWATFHNGCLPDALMCRIMSSGVAFVMYWVLGSRMGCMIGCRQVTCQTTSTSVGQIA